MAEKKNQHLVPACYLEAFISANVNEQQKQNPHFEAGIYVNSKNLNSEWKMKGIHHKIFTKSYYYNLPIDNPSTPYIENYLSSVESKYKSTLRKIH